MNRMEEYRAMLAELRQPNPGLDATLNRAYGKRRKKIRRMILRPAAGLAACFMGFVLLVNFCAPVAYACSRIPFLRELAEAVTFSKSLSDAVENAFVQPMELSQTENGIRAEVAYLIVDQKQVNVFYRLDSEKYPSLSADPDVRNADDTSPVSCIVSSSEFACENGELRRVSIDFTDGNVPGSLKLKLNVYANGITGGHMAPENEVQDIFGDAPDEERSYLARFEFLLAFDPAFTAAGRVFPVDQRITLDGQSITVTDMEIYPTHLRVNIAESEANTAWLKDLDFYIQTDLDMRFAPVASGITATGSADTPSMVSYRADSPYFCQAKHLKLVITGARWLRKDLDRTWVDLVTGETGELPEGVSFDSARRTGDGWIVRFRADWEEGEPMGQLFQSTFYDGEGNRYEINMWSSRYGEEDENGKITFFYDEFPLKDYPYDQVWLCPQYTHDWTGEETLEITVP